jgi:hypothetical protein
MATTTTKNTKGARAAKKPMPKKGGAKGGAKCATSNGVEYVQHATTGILEVRHQGRSLLIQMPRRNGQVLFPADPAAAVQAWGHLLSMAPGAYTEGAPGTPRAGTAAVRWMADGSFRTGFIVKGTATPGNVLFAAKADGNGSPVPLAEVLIPTAEAPTQATPIK